MILLSSRETDRFCILKTKKMVVKQKKKEGRSNYLGVRLLPRAVWTLPCIVHTSPSVICLYCSTQIPLKKKKEENSEVSLRTMRALASHVHWERETSRVNIEKKKTRKEKQKR